MTIKILAFSGSSRQDSLNQRLLEVASAGARSAGAEVTPLRLADLALPVYDGDLEAEQGLPPGALKFKALLAGHDGLLIASPEYNGGYTALLKNALDWASRPSETDRNGVSGFANRPAALVSASPGLLGAIRSQVSLQGVLLKLGLVLIPSSFALGSAHQAFDEHGTLRDAGVDRGVRAVGAALAEAARRHARSSQD